ncbi:MAG: 1-deoxy-D-xylulose-5-phosphate synthase [Thermoleophilaceae bacterium]|nr:1-deoxy-D-xylulose-5-phosphate synthase [Thermoleophilaceae bacterium]
MRRAFVESLVELAERDDSVVLLTGDLGYTVIEPFAERYPGRFFNVGVAEQNMIGMATGLTSFGLKPFAYSIATFASMRGYEFIRNGPVLHELPVRVVGVGDGFDYGPNGATHFPLEDVALMRVQPGLAVVAPADPVQTRSAMLALADLPGPAYIKLGKGGTPVPGLEGRFRLGRTELIGDGEDVAILAYGSMAAEAVEAMSLLEAEGVRSTVGVVASLAPPPVEDLAELLDRVPLAIALEAHYLTGGLGSLVSEVVAERGLACRVIRQGMATLPRGQTGSPAFMRSRHGLTAQSVADSAVTVLESTR